MSLTDVEMPKKRKMSQSKLTVAVMGRAMVGKTAILNQYIRQVYIDRYWVTVGDKHSKVIEVNDRQVELEILDTAGGYCFEYGRRQAITNADAFVLVYSVDEILSFQKVFELREEIIEKRGDDIPIVAVQTKIDLPQDKWFSGCSSLQKNIPSGWADPHFQVSAKDGSDMSEIFEQVVSICDDSNKHKYAREERRGSAIAAIEDILSAEQIWFM